MLRLGNNFRFNTNKFWLESNRWMSFPKIDLAHALDICQSWLTLKIRVWSGGRTLNADIESELN